MRKSHVVAAFLTLGSLAALPACSMNSPSSSAPAPAPVAMAQPELSPGMVRQVQASLQQQGLYHGSIDGLWGPQTQAAVMSYQQAHGLTANGELTSPTLASLNLPSDGTAPVVATAPAAPAPAPMAAAPAAPEPAPMAAAPAAQSTTTTTTLATPIAPAPATTTQ